MKRILAVIVPKRGEGNTRKAWEGKNQKEKTYPTAGEGPISTSQGLREWQTLTKRRDGEGQRQKKKNWGDDDGGAPKIASPS